MAHQTFQGLQVCVAREGSSLYLLLQGNSFYCGLSRSYGLQLQSSPSIRHWLGGF